jgi:hypothetical protein
MAEPRVATSTPKVVVKPSRLILDMFPLTADGRDVLARLAKAVGNRMI